MLLKVLFAYSRGNGWFWQVGWDGVPTYHGVKYDTWVCHSGFRAHQTFLEMVTQFEPTISIDAFFSVDKAVQICSITRFTFNSMLNFFISVHEN